MSIHNGAAPTVGYRQALTSVRVIFLLSGLLFATWAARIPTVKDSIGLDEAGLAIVFAGLNIGAIVGLQLGKFLTLRFGSRSTLRVTVPVFAVCLPGLLLVPDRAGLTVAAVVFAMSNSVVDVAMNAHGVAVEKSSGRSLLSGIHAYFSMGMIGGSLIGVAAERAEISLTAHFWAVALLTMAAALMRSNRLLPSVVDRVGSAVGEAGRVRQWPTRLIVLGLLAFAVALVEGAANDWSAVYLRDETHASGAAAAVGFAIFAAGMTLGRFAGDHLVARFGPVRPFLAGTLTAGIGFGAALLIGGTIPGFIGLALLGFGISYTLPLTFAAGGDVPGIPVARAIANISILGYCGFFTGPVLIGFLAHRWGLTLGLAVPVAIVLVAALGSRALRPPARSHAHSETSCPENNSH
ncbi:MFS transporter [Nocardia huaxiensis]|uniref:MFS transporter n=1 Tax=Nocardia huaxiensis TaxID=2755382 RepID=UPI001E436480|nr:MFS transporter [Nocardia huaxiensis]UFS98064.1 MFS transporter [Nocardia huaxiensis]